MAGLNREFSASLEVEESELSKLFPAIMKNPAHYFVTDCNGCPRFWDNISLLDKEVERLIAQAKGVEDLHKILKTEANKIGDPDVIRAANQFLDNNRKAAAAHRKFQSFIRDIMSKKPNKSL